LTLPNFLNLSWAILLKRTSGIHNGGYNFFYLLCAYTYYYYYWNIASHRFVSYGQCFFNFFSLGHIRENISLNKSSPCQLSTLYMHPWSERILIIRDVLWLTNNTEGLKIVCILSISPTVSFCPFTAELLLLMMMMMTMMRQEQTILLQPPVTLTYLNFERVIYNLNMPPQHHQQSQQKLNLVLDLCLHRCFKSWWKQYNPFFLHNLKENNFHPKESSS